MRWTSNLANPFYVQVDGEADAMKGDEKAMGLMREMESDLWAEGRFNDNDREGAIEHVYPCV